MKDTAMLKGILQASVVVLFALGVSPAAHAGTKTIDFTKSGAEAGWKSLVGTWKVSPKGYKPKNVFPEGTEWATTIYKKKKYSDFTLTVKTSPASEPFGNSHPVYAWVRSSYTKSGGFYWLKGYSVMANFYESDGSLLARIYRYDSLKLELGEGGKSEILCWKEHNFGKFSNFDLKIVAEGSSLKVYYGKKLICSATDRKFKSGSIAYTTQNFSYENIAVPLRAVVIED